MPLDAIIRNTY